MARARGDVIINLLAILMLLEIAALAGLGGYLLLTNKVTAEQARLAYKVYQGQVTEQVLADAESWKKHQEEEARKKEDVVSGADATTKMAATSAEAEAARLGILTLMNQLQDREKLLQVKLEDYERKRQDLVDMEKRIDDKIRRQNEAGGRQNFQKMLQIMEGMKPPDLKEVLVKMDDTTATDVLKALDARVAAKVLAELTSPSEMEIKRRYLDMIRSGEQPRTATPGGP